MDHGLELERSMNPGITGEAPSKSFVQHYRLQTRSVLMLLMFGIVVATDRTLSGTATGSLLYGVGALLIFAAVVGRFWCYVYNSGARSKTVITEGPYSVCRNPIYVCSIAAVVGFGLLTESLLLAAVFGGAALVFYVHIIKGEEAKMTGLHGSTYLAYLERTPRYIPSPSLLSPGVIKNIPGRTLMRKIPKLLLMSLMFPAVEVCNQISGLLQLDLFPII